MHLIPVLQADEIHEDRPVPSLRHARTAQRLGFLLERIDERLVALQQLNLNLDGWQTIPDICIYPRDILPADFEEDIEEVTKPPLLVVEVLSPHQVLGALMNKTRQYLTHGVGSCWVIMPQVRVVTHLPKNGPSRTYGEGALRDEALGIEIDVAEIFR